MPPTTPDPHFPPAAPRSTWLEWGLAVAAAALALGYLHLFFGYDLNPKEDVTQLRYLFFTYLLTPDDLAREWVGGSWANFSLFDRWPIWVGAGWVLFGAAAVGQFCLTSQSLAGIRLSRLERWPLALGLGLHLMSLLTLGLGLLGRLRNPLILFIPLVCFLTLAIYSYYGYWKHEDESLDHDSDEPKSRLLVISEWGLAIIAGLFAMMILLGAMLPPIEFDVREYHLQVPKEWSQQGHVSFLPHNVYGNMPLGAEIHSLWLMQLELFSHPWWWGALAGKVVIACFAPLTALALYVLGRQHFSKLAGLAAAAVYLSSPWVIHVSVNGLNDAAVGFYLVAALLAALPRRDGQRAAGLSGLLAGGAAACKYPALLFVVAPLAIYLLVGDFARRLEQPFLRRFAWGRMTVFLACAAVSCGLWYGKNWILTGNPTYPLFASVFGGQTRTPEKTAQWEQAHKTPANTLANASDSATKITWRDNMQSPLLVPLSVLGLIALGSAVRSRKDEQGISRHAPRPKPHSRHVLTVTTLMLVFFIAAWWLFTHRLERFLVPALPLAAILAGAGVEFAQSRPLKYVAGCLLAVGLTYCFLFAGSTFPGDNRWFVSVERLRTDIPRHEQAPSRVRPAHRWLNERLQRDEAVLCVGDSEVFDLEMHVYYNTCFDDCLLVNWMQGKSRAQRREELHGRNIKYVYVDRAELARYLSPGNYGYDPRLHPELLDELVRQGVLQQPLADAPESIYPVAP